LDAHPVVDCSVLQPRRWRWCPSTEGSPEYLGETALKAGVLFDVLAVLVELVAPIRRSSPRESSADHVAGSIAPSPPRRRRWLQLVDEVMTSPSASEISFKTAFSRFQLTAVLGAATMEPRSRRDHALALQPSGRPPRRCGWPASTMAVLPRRARRSARVVLGAPGETDDPRSPRRAR